MYLIRLLLGLVYYFPAFVANGSGPLVKNGTPIDFRKNFQDGRRILGDGKTFEGLLMGLTYGTTVGVVLSFFFWSSLDNHFLHGGTGCNAWRYGWGIH